MVQDKEKAVLIHWYYSVAEWQDFLKQERRTHEIRILIEAVLIGLACVLGIRFGRHNSWIPAIIIGGSITIAYGLLKYCLPLWLADWRRSSIPEIRITDDIVTTNGKPVIFQGNGKQLRKVDIKEMNNINVLEISYEWRTDKGVAFDEIRIPVPKGKLREAIELQDCLNLRRDVLSIFS